MDKVTEKYGWFAQNLRELRAAEHRLSQGKMARELGISTATIQHIEDGRSKSPGILHLCAIAEYFSVPIEDFLQKDLSTTNKLETSISFLRNEMSDKERRQILAGIDAERKDKRESGHYRRKYDVTRK